VPLRRFRASQIQRTWRNKTKSVCSPHLLSMTALGQTTIRMSRSHEKNNYMLWSNPWKTTHGFCVIRSGSDRWWGAVVIAWVALWFVFRLSVVRAWFCSGGVVHLPRGCIGGWTWLRRKSSNEPKADLCCFANTEKRTGKTFKMIRVLVIFFAETFRSFFCNGIHSSA